MPDHNTEPKLEPGSLSSDAIKAASTAIKDLIVARNPNEPLSEKETATVDVWVGIALAVGFERGRRLASAQSDMHRLDSMHLPDGYPT